MNEFGRTLVSVYLPLYFLIDLKTPVLLVGLALTVSLGTSAFFQAVGGILADSWGRRKPMLVGTAGRAIIVVLLSLFSTITPSFVLILLLFTLSEALNGIFLTSANAMVSDVTTLERRVEGFGIYRVAINAGFILGSLLGGMLTLFTSSFYIWSATILLNFAIMLVFLRESGGGRHNNGSGSFRFSSVFSASKDRILLGFAITSVAAGMIANQFGPTFTLFTTQYLDISKQNLGYLYTLNGIMVILFQYPLSRLTVKYRLTAFIAISVMVQSISYLLVNFSTSILLLQVVVVGLTIGEMLQAPSGPAFASAIAPEERRGEYIGFFSWGWNSGQASSPLIGGFLLSIFAGSDYLIWYVVFAIGVVCSLAYLSVGAKARRANPELDNIL